MRRISVPHLNIQLGPDIWFSGLTWVATGKCGVIVQMDFSAETISKFNSRTIRVEAVSASPLTVRMLQAPSASSLYVTTSETPNYALVTTTSWSPSVSTVGIDASFDGQEVFLLLNKTLNLIIIGDTAQAQQLLMLMVSFIQTMD
jgi:hypothetical protein